MAGTSVTMELGQQVKDDLKCSTQKPQALDALLHLTDLGPECILHLADLEQECENRTQTECLTIHEIFVWDLRGRPSVLPVHIWDRHKECENCGQRAKDDTTRWCPWG